MKHYSNILCNRCNSPILVCTCHKICIDCRKHLNSKCKSLGMYNSSDNKKDERVLKNDG